MLAFFGLAILLTSPLSIAEKIGTGKYSDNCVKYLRYERGAKLPGTDLTYWPEKLKSIRTNKAKKGRVAIIEIPHGQYKSYGHVALVTNVDDKGKKKSITIEEANYPSPGYWRRKVEGRSLSEVEKKLNIRGYYKS